MTSSRSKWVSEHRESLIECGLLVLAIATLLQLASFQAWPLTAKLAPLVAAVLISGRQVQSDGFWARFWRRMPYIAAASAVTLLVHRFWNGLPWKAAWLGPIWAGFIFGYHLVDWISAHWDRLQARLKETRRWDLLLGEAGILAIAWSCADGFWAGGWAPARFLPVAVACWVGFRAWQSSPLRLGTPWSDCLHGAASFIAFTAVCIGLEKLAGVDWSLSQWVMVVWGAVGIGTLRFLAPALIGQDRAETLRWILLLSATFWLMRPFWGTTLHGTGDAQWYATMLADAVSQTRAGIFPLWLGQSEYQYSGVIYPLRVAPLFHYLGVLLDTLTLRTLGVFALQNLLLTTIAASAVVSTYLCTAALLPHRKDWAVALAILFLSSPGVLGMAYISDLLMSWTTLPWVPVAWYSVVRSFQTPDRKSMLLLGLSLGLCWWGHTPIALWCTLLAAAAQILRLVIQRRLAGELPHIVVGALCFTAVAAYPVGSVLLFPPEPGVSASSFQEATAHNIYQFILEVFPRVLLPLSDSGRALSDLQLGYALWAVLLVLIAWNIRNRSGAATVLGCLAVLLIVLLTPIPGVTLKLWSLLPSFVRDTTSNWVMNRLYLVLAVLVLFAFVAWVSRFQREALQRRRAITCLLLCGCIWAILESNKFIRTSQLTRRAAGTASSLVQPENIMITRFAYLMFPKLPATYTHGANDPLVEHRLLARDDLSVLQDNGSVALSKGIRVSTLRLTSSPEDSGTYKGSQSLQLHPGKRYLHQWTFPEQAQVDGVLHYKGDTLALVYALPEYGGSEFFGVGGIHRNWVPLRTTRDAIETVEVRFVPASGLDPVGLQACEATLIEYEESMLPVEVTSWAPYKAVVRAEKPAWLETPRMYQAAFRASANGAPAEVRKSPRGFCLVAVPAGTTQVVLSFVPPAGLVSLFVLSATSLLLAGVLGIRRVWRTAQHATPQEAPRAPVHP